MNKAIEKKTEELNKINYELSFIKNELKDIDKSNNEKKKKIEDLKE